MTLPFASTRFNPRSYWAFGTVVVSKLKLVAVPSSIGPRKSGCAAGPTGLLADGHGRPEQLGLMLSGQPMKNLAWANVPPVQLAVKAGCIVPLTVMGLPKVVGAVHTGEQVTLCLKKRQPPDSRSSIESTIRTNFRII